MTANRQPCEVGRTLFAAFCAEYEKIGGGEENLIRVPADPNHPCSAAWRAWQEHKDSCEKCGVTK